MTRKYRPSNGTEGLGFMECWCCECERDRDFRDDAGDGCPILARTVIHDVDDPEYPEEWTYGEDGLPMCTAFVPIGKPCPTERELEAEGQQNMFDAA